MNLDQNCDLRSGAGKGALTQIPGSGFNGSLAVKKEAAEQIELLSVTSLSSKTHSTKGIRDLRAKSPEIRDAWRIREKK